MACFKVVNLYRAFLGAVFLGLAPHSIKAMQKSLNRHNEERIALNAGLYGNKGAHQYELEDIAQILNQRLQAKRFPVPSFYTAQHTELAAYLKGIPYQDSTVYENLQTNWKLLVDSQKRHNGRTLAPEARVFIHQIAQVLSYAAATKPFGGNTDSFRAFLRGIQGRVIARSSGRTEDSKTVSLAGAYESIGNLSPELDDVTQGMCEVLASYFSEKALSQRIAAQDEHFYDDPFLAVLIQKMVGLTGIPISGVLFTQEAEGRTPGVADIRCVWGLNDGFVNSLVSFDTYYVGPSRTIYPLIGNKLSRIVAGKKRGTIEQVANDAALHRKPCLTHQLILDLKLCAEVVEEYYGCPQDVEFVIDNEFIYLVQSRPITHDETDENLHTFPLSL